MRARRCRTHWVLVLAVAVFVTGCSLLGSKPPENTMAPEAGTSPRVGASATTATTAPTPPASTGPSSAATAGGSAAGVSPAYTVEISAVQEGTCGYEKVAGWFDSLRFSTQFTRVRFAAPSRTAPYGAIFVGNQPPVGVPYAGILGSGKLDDEDLCPDWETETDMADVYITRKVLTFEPSLALAPLEGDTLCPVPLISPVPNAVNGGGDTRLFFNIGLADDGGPIMSWESRIAKGSLGLPGAALGYMFCFDWNQLLSGREYKRTETDSSSHAFETYTWSIHLIPA